MTFLRLAGWAAIGLVGAVVAPSVTPLDPSVHAFGNALVVGTLGGTVVFFALSRRRFPPALASSIPRPRLLARGVVLMLKSAQEEAIWRAVVLGALVGPLGRIGALALSTVLFAGAHAGRLGRGAAVHLATGAAFGLAYVVTGRLSAAIAAHGTYNVMVGVAALSDPDTAVLDSRHRSRPLLASVEPVPPRGMQETAPLPASPVASLERVSKSFGGLTALDGIDLAVHPGEVVALLGPNGAGKSTAVALMLGLRRPDSGRALLFGRDPRDAEARRGVAVVLQDVGFPPALRVRETVDLVCAHFPNATTSRAALDRLGLGTVGERWAGGLSGGQRRRLAVALAFAAGAEALFLDEPTAGIDALARRGLLRDVSRFAASGGSVLLTTQQLAEAEEIATRVVVLAAGRVLVEGTVGEVRGRAGLARVSLRAATLPRLAGTTTVESHGDRHVVYVDDADAFVEDLVRSGVAFRELEVAPVRLEDALLTLMEAAPE
jgi:ABC-2 type transport system ATP-binding protein